MKFFITGATGFIGTHLCHLLVEADHEVVALVRNPKKAQGLPQKNVTTLKGDLTLFKKQDTQIPPCDVVIHLAGVVAAKSVRDYHEINYQAVIDLVDCLERQIWTPKRLVFASSLAAAGPSAINTPLKETDPANPIEPYGQAKWEAEQFLQKCPFPTTSFRPGAVIGPGDPAFFTLFKLAHHRFGFKVLGLDQQISYIYVSDLVESIVKMAFEEGNQDKTYFVSYKKHMDTPLLWKTFSEVMNKKIFVASVPKPVLFTLMVLGTALSKIIPFKNQLDIKQYKQITTPAFLCSSEALQKDLQWDPQHDLKSTIEKTHRGYKEAGWL